MGEGQGSRPLVRGFHACLLVLGSVIALHVAVAYLKPIIPWLIGVAVLVVCIWAVVAFIRWRRARW